MTVEPDVVEWIERHVSGVVLDDWQRQVLRAWQRGEEVIITTPRIWGRRQVVELHERFTEWERTPGG